MREDLLFEPEVQAEVVGLLEKAYEGNSPHYKKWQKAMNLIRQFSLQETAKRRKKELKTLAAARAELNVVNRFGNKYGWTEDSLTNKNELQSQIFQFEHPEAPHLASAAAAKSMTDRSESCTTY